MPLARVIACSAQASNMLISYGLVAALKPLSQNTAIVPSASDTSGASLQEPLCDVPRAPVAPFGWKTSAIIYGVAPEGCIDT
jgi:hypothetical protein